MLKLKGILAAANAKVAEYMAQGYMISWMNASFGYKFRVDLEKNGASFEELEHLTLGGLRKAVVDGDVTNGSVMAGQSAAMVKEIMSCKDLIQKLVSETDALIGGKGFYE